MARGAQEGLQVGRQGQRHRRRHSVVVVFSLVGGVVCFRLAPLFFFFFCPLPFAVDAAAQASFDRSSFFSFCFSCRRRCGGSAGGFGNSKPLALQIGGQGFTQARLVID